MEDGQIVELYWQRDERAIDETEIKYGGYCFTVAGRILPVSEDAEECVSDTWLHAWNSMPPNRPQKLRCFLAKITRNLSLDRLRAQTAEKRGGGQVTLALDELTGCLAAREEDEGFAAGELADSVDRFLRTLAKRERNVFLRRYFYFEPVAEIAARYEMSENAAAVLLHRTRKKLREYLMREGYFG